MDWFVLSRYAYHWEGIIIFQKQGAGKYWYSNLFGFQILVWYADMDPPPPIPIVFSSSISYGESFQGSDSTCPLNNPQITNVFDQKVQLYVLLNEVAQPSSIVSYGKKPCILQQAKLPLANPSRTISPKEQM